jgi:hypothetical protein
MCTTECTTDDPFYKMTYKRQAGHTAAMDWFRGASIFCQI